MAQIRILKLEYSQKLSSILLWLLYCGVLSGLMPTQVFRVSYGGVLVLKHGHRSPWRQQDRASVWTGEAWSKKWGGERSVIASMEKQHLEAWIEDLSWLDQNSLLIFENSCRVWMFYDWFIGQLKLKNVYGFIFWLIWKIGIRITP